MSILDGVQKVLSLYAQGVGPQTFSEIAARLALPKSSASRLLNQMQLYGLLDQDPASRRYRPGNLLALAVQADQASTPLDDACREVLTRLSERSGMTAYLSTLNGPETVVLQRLNGSHPVQVLSSPGSRRAAAGTAMGRAMLARLDDAQLAALYGDDGALPPGREGRDPPASVAALRQRVERAREARCAVAIDEAMPGIGAVAAAVRDPASGELRGLCVSFVSFEISDDQVQTLRALLLREVGALGARLGDPYWAGALPAATDVS